MSTVAAAPARHSLELEAGPAATAAPHESGGVFYGWCMALLVTVVLVASSPGQTYGFTFFNPSLRQSLHLSQTQMSAMYLAATLLAALPMTLIGGLTDRFGLKRSIVAAVGAMAAACIFAATVETMATLFVACLAMRTLGPGVMSLLANNTLAAWFDRRLGLASGMVQMAMAATIALAPLGMMALISAVGWREAYALIGAGIFAAVLPLVWLGYREHPGEVGQYPDGDAGPTLRLFDGNAAEDAEGLDLRAAARTPVFWILMSVTATWSLMATGLVFHLEGLLSSRGLTAESIRWATPLMAACMAAMQLGGGFVADRAPVSRLIVAALAAIATACGLLAAGAGGALLAGYAAYGLGQGLMSIVSATAWARYFGREHLGRIRGTSLSANIAASALGPLLMGVSADCTGGFELSLWAFMACSLALIGGVWWKCRELANIGAGRSIIGRAALSAPRARGAATRVAP